MKLDQLASKPNLRLAWRRITSGSNHQYKKFYRDLYYVYEVALDANLKDLRKRILGESFEPQNPERVYVPKASGLHRPIALLSLEDQIVLQAFANLAAGKMQKHRKPLQFKAVFSNILQKPDSIFFFRPWRWTYYEFEERIHKHYQEGARWVGDFDLAAFYDTVSHELLLKTLYPRTSSESLSWVAKCLQTWSSDNPASDHGHGLPQGPIASDILAECFMLPVDLKLCGKYRYTRYVDDIRLFGDNEKEVRKGLVELESSCRERGLIPQAGKFGIRRARGEKDAMGMLPSISDPRDQAGEDKIDKKTATTIFLSSVDGKPRKVTDKTKLRYVLYRAEPDGGLLDRVLPLISRHPENADAFFAFLGRFGYRRPIERLCLEIVERSPYPYIRGEAWHLLAVFLRKSNSPTVAEAKELVDKAAEVARRKTAENFAERWGACRFLCAAEETKGIQNRRLVKRQKPLLQSLLAPVLPNAMFENGRVVETYLRQENPEPGLSVCAALHERGLTPGSFGVCVEDLPSQVVNTLRELGVTSAPPSKVDPIAEIVKSRYQIAEKKSWNKFLGDQYVYALGILKRAEAAFSAGPSFWLICQNSFNQTIFLVLQSHLNDINHPAACRTIDRNGNLINFGSTLDVKGPFSQNFPGIAGCFRDMNARRNSLPPTHPYEKKTGAQSEYLKPRERNRFVNELRKTYADFVELMP